MLLMDDVGDLDVEEVSWSPGGALAHRVPAPSLRLPEQAGLLRECQQPVLGCVGEKRPAEQSVEQLRGHRQPIASQHAALTNPSMGSIADLEIEEDWSDMDMLPPWQGQVSSGEVVLPHNDPAWHGAALPSPWCRRLVQGGMTVFCRASALLLETACLFSSLFWHQGPRRSLEQ